MFAIYDNKPFTVLKILRDHKNVWRAYIAAEGEQALDVQASKLKFFENKKGLQEAVQAAKDLQERKQQDVESSNNDGSVGPGDSSGLTDNG